MKNTRAITTEYRMAQWTEIMRERAESGLNITAYCKREGMPANRYFYWQRRLRAAAKEMIPAKAETTAPVPSGWTEVVTSKPIVAEEAKSSEISELTIEIGKSRLTVNDGTNTELLTKVCKVLVGLC